jgi:hypothetical protein
MIEERKVTTMTIRLSMEDYARVKRVCNRDEIKPAVFAYERLMDGINDLIKKQEKEGYQCMNLL